MPGWFASNQHQTTEGPFHSRFAFGNLRGKGWRPTIRNTASRLLPRGCAEAKLVRCLKGAIWDVIVDIRPNSPTYHRWQAFELSETSNCQLYIPKGFAHGFQTLKDNVEVSNLISGLYAPENASGIRYDDPKSCD
jgi:dTDP-4-dehydrorhamnose 3,5-epimerase